MQNHASVTTQSPTINQSWKTEFVKELNANIGIAIVLGLLKKYPLQ